MVNETIRQRMNRLYLNSFSMQSTEGECIHKTLFGSMFASMCIVQVGLIYGNSVSSLAGIKGFQILNYGIYSTDLVINWCGIWKVFFSEKSRTICTECGVFVVFFAFSEEWSFVNIWEFLVAQFSFLVV